VKKLHLQRPKVKNLNENVFHFMTINMFCIYIGRYKLNIFIHIFKILVFMIHFSSPLVLLFDHHNHVLLYKSHLLTAIHQLVTSQFLL
jgi:hypothetical protein